jgi:hypothetical protein
MTRRRPPLPSRAFGIIAAALVVIVAIAMRLP